MLPKKYCEIMRKLLGEEYSAYEASMNEEARTAIRVNTAKISIEQWQSICPFEVEPVPWTEKGFILTDSTQNPAKHPYYYAGLYYIQEPSAMIPAGILPVRKGERLLDLCAAPGGKATELAAKLQGEGVLAANDISVSRGMALAKNLQIAGAANAVVTAETPEKLAGHFPEYFDKIIIDAPCSGEGMFRRDSHMIQDWEEHGPAYYAAVQRDILVSAYQMLRRGGSLVYSTCTFSPEEDEEMVLWFLREFSDMQVCEVERKPGFSSGRPDWVGQEITHREREQLERCIRIFPHRAVGEGHFAVLLRKGEEFTGDGLSIRQDVPGKKKNHRNSSRSISEEAERWTSLAGYSTENLVMKKDKVLLETGLSDHLQGLRCIQTGLIAGEAKKRFEPSVQLALAVRDITAFPRIDFSAEDIRVLRYLKGETLQDVKVEDEELLKSTEGYVLICVDGFSLGWGKYTGSGTVKNKYYAGWRMQ